MYLINKEEQFRFKTRPYFTCPTAMLIMAKPKTGKTTLVLDQPKMAVYQFDNEASKTETTNMVDMRLYKKISKETIEKITIGKGKLTLSPKFYVTDKLNNLGYHIPPSIYDLAVEASEEMKEYKLRVRALNNARALEDQDAYDQALVELRSYVTDRMTCPIAVIDNLTSIMDEVLLCALSNYYHNNEKAAKKRSIKEIDIYGGVRFIREALKDIANFIYENIAPVVVFIGHTDPKITNKDNVEMVSRDLMLEGKLGDLFTTAVDTVCILDKKPGDGMWLMFNKSTEDQSLGSRSHYLDGKEIKIADWMEPGTHPKDVKRYWNRVFPDIYGDPS